VIIYDLVWCDFVGIPRIGDSSAITISGGDYDRRRCGPHDKRNVTSQSQQAPKNMANRRHSRYSNRRDDSHKSSDYNTAYAVDGGDMVFDKSSCIHRTFVENKNTSPNIPDQCNLTFGF